FPWICIKNERFPRIFSTRTKINDGSEYFGPYASVGMMKTLLGLIRQLYKIRTCKYDLSEKNIALGKFKVCLEYHIGNCRGPCEGLQSHEDYMLQITEVKEIIKGNIGSVISILENRMNVFADKMEYESAFEIKENIDTLLRYKSKSTVVNPAIGNVDVFSVISDLHNGYVNYLKVVDGAVIQSHTMAYKKKLEESDAELLEMGIAEIHIQFNTLAREILIPEAIDM